MKILAIIPARGGSKRIPRKNIKNFVGRPIIKYSISAAKEAGCFNEIMVSTDDPEIARMAESCGARVPFFRSKKNSDNRAMIIPVLAEVLMEYKKRGKKFEYVCCIFPTAPFVTGEKLRNAKQLILKNKADAVMPMVRFSYPIQRALKINGRGAKMFWPKYYNCRSQDLEPAYHDCGQFYFLASEAILKQKKLFPKFLVPIEIPETEAQDIDNETDWQIAEMKYKLLNKKTG
ncbi:MAG: pseudaminic acid cytidylyltransferase [Candidatus Yanofskybacteria bacterium RIFOXYD1_FULL_42_10]|uniref:Pseudaminic acid cytidylyltransferase n=2 Tax=Parcubacteria group TaxID=1794811 RepID=A0A1F8HVU1_9BACT|nr:MAG: pseudaminic acid cytidylyltransferase [Candidatus Yanofskybacteria bacterium RIFOXYD1_FULL_42_10]